MSEQEKFWTDAPAEVLGYYAKAHRFPPDKFWAIEPRSWLLGVGDIHNGYGALTLRSINPIPDRPIPTSLNTQTSE